MRLYSLGIIIGLATGLSALNAQESTMSWLDNGQIRLGVDLAIGGSVTYLADSKTGENVINSADWGRQIQMSFYSGPTPYQPEGKQLAESWKGLGWNPIQSGDFYGNRSTLLTHENKDNTIYIKCVPMHWPLNNVPGECTFEVWYSLAERTVQVRCRLNNHRPDRTQYPGRHQELPAVYTNGPYHKLMTYQGDKPFAGDALSEIPKQDHPAGGIRWANWYATENWAALVNDRDWGLGVWNPSAHSFIGGFACGQPGTGGPKDGPTGYISPVLSEILDHNIVYDYHYALILDSLDNIRKYIYATHKKPPLPDYRFDGNRQHFIYRNGTDSGWPPAGCLEVTAGNAPLELLGPDECWPAAPGHKIKIVMAVTPAGESQNRAGQACLYWKTFQNRAYRADRRLPFAITLDGQSHEYLLNLGQQTGYLGLIGGLRLDPLTGSRPGDRIKLFSLSVIP